MAGRTGASQDAVSQLQVKVDCHRRLRPVGQTDDRLERFKDILRRALETECVFSLFLFVTYC